MQFRSRIEASLKTVIWNPAIQVMYVVKADASRKPLEDRRKLEVRASAERGRVEIPVAVAFPMGRVELMLHIEQPVTGPRGDDDHGKIRSDDGKKAEYSEGDPEYREQREIEQ